MTDPLTIPITCPRCRAHSELRADGADDTATCAFCGTTFHGLVPVPPLPKRRAKTPDELSTILEAIAPSGVAALDGIRWFVHVTEAGGNAGWLRIEGRCGELLRWYAILEYRDDEPLAEITVRARTCLLETLRDQHDAIIAHAQTIQRARASRSS